MTSRRILYAIIALLVAADLGLALFWHPVPPAAERALPAPTVPAGGDFEVESANGPIRLRDLRGKVVLLYFGYTYCPDICPTALLATSAALHQLTAAELAKVQTLFISVDPERDTVKQLAAYSAFYHPNIIGATSTPERLAEIATRYGVTYRKQSIDGSANYVVDHSTATYVIDPQGKLAATLPHAAPPEQTLAAIRALITSSSTPGVKP